MQDIQAIPPSIMELARQLLSFEATQCPGQDTSGRAIENIYIKLGARLTVLIGQRGFVALVERALHLARRETPTLAALSIDPHPPNNLAGAREVANVRADDAETPFVGVVAHLIWLLMSFIGEHLSMQLIFGIWPHLVPDEPTHGGIES